MSVELATAWVSLVPSTQGIKGQLNRQLKGPLEAAAADAGRSSGRGFVANFAGNAVSGLDAVGGRIVSGLGTAFKVAGGLAAASFGGSLAAGFSRLRAIDDARFKLQGLGHDAASVEAIMDSALTSVKGTAFGLGDAATIAAGAVAAGIEPGDELTRVLSLTGDAATIAGVSLGEMGAIFGKVAASNRMMTQEMNQLQDRGLPVLQWLQDELGATADEVRDMVSSGEVDFATFTRIVEDNIGGAALTAGESFRGSLANVGAAIGRLGAAFLAPAFQAGPALFARMIEGIDAATDRVGPFAEAVGVRLVGAFQTVGQAVGPVLADVRSLASMFGEAASGMQVVTEGLSPIEQAVVRIGEAFAAAREFIAGNQAVFAGIGAALTSTTGILAGAAVAVNVLKRAWLLLVRVTPLGAIITLGTALTYAWQHSETFRDVITGAFDAVRAVVGPVVAVVTAGVERLGEVFSGGGAGGAMEALGGVASRVGDTLRAGFGAAVEWLGELWERLSPRFAAIGESFSGIAETLAPVVAWIGERLPGAFAALWKVAGPVLGFLVNVIGEALMTAIDGVVGVFQGLVGIIEGALNIIAGLFTGDWSRMWEGLKQVAVGAFTAIVGAVKVFLSVGIGRLFKLGFTLLRNLAKAGWGAIRGVFTSAGQGIANFVRGLFDSIRLRIMYALDSIKLVITTTWKAIPALFRAGTNLLRGIVQRAFQWVLERVGFAMGRVREAVSKNLDRAIRFFRDLPRKIIGALGNVGRMLFDAGRNIVQGLIDGIRAMIGKVGDTIGDVAGKIRGFMPFSPAKEGPLSGRGSPDRAGRAIGEMLAAGMTDTVRLVRVATGQLAEAARAEAEPILAGLATSRPLTVRALPVDGDDTGTSSTRSGFHVDNLTVNYPDREPASQGIEDSLMALSYRWGAR